MPTTPCPVCKADVKFSKDAEPGSTVTCPECEEVFTPPKLKKKGYDPKKEGAYKVGKANSNRDEVEKTRKAAAAMRGASERARRFAETGNRRRGWFDGPEVWLLILAAGLGTGLPFGLWLARSWEKLGEKKTFLIIAVMLAVMVAAVGLGGSAWAWLRKNR